MISPPWKKSSTTETGVARSPSAHGKDTDECVCFAIFNIPYDGGRSTIDQDIFVAGTKATRQVWGIPRNFAHDANCSIYR